MNENWKKVIGYEDLFLISDHGNLFSLRTNKILTSSISKTGYVLISTKIGGRNGTNKCFRLHREVAKCFVENVNNFIEVNHIDGNKINNHYSNLEWVTPKENMQHALRNGLMEHNIVSKKKASYNSRALLEEDVEYIRKNYIKSDKNFGSRALGRKYGVDKNRILEIVKFITYKYF
jgi:hypothetical protein